MKIKLKEGKMDRAVTIGIIGDYDEKKTSHPATNNAIRHAADFLSIKAKATWLPTPSFLTKEGQPKLEEFDAIWASPGSPYRSMDGAIEGIRLAREIGRPFIGT
jgi:CTP synthase (UTP-ammonia lyase)